MCMHYGTIAGVPRPLSRVIHGTVTLSPDRQDEANQLLDAAVAAGITTFDTAHGYGHGHSERAIGAWLRERAPTDVVIITKGAHPANGRNRVTAEDITADLHESLERLGRATVDLYLLHRDDPTVPVGELVDVLDAHARAGRIRAYGGSNWSPERLAAANEYAAAHQRQPFVASSPHCSLAVQVQPAWPGCLSISGEQNRADRAWYASQHMPLITWSSLAGGFFSGRFQRDNLQQFTDYFDTVCVNTYASDDNFGRLERAQALASELGVSTAHVALAYVLSLPLDIYAITSGRTPEEIAQNAAAIELHLTPEQCRWLDQGE